MRQKLNFSVKFKFKIVHYLMHSPCLELHLENTKNSTEGNAKCFSL